MPHASPFALFVALLALPAGAATHRVPADFASIQAAVDAADTGDVIQVAKGSYLEQVLVSGKFGLLIQGKGKPELDADGGDHALHIEDSQDIRVEGFTIQGASDALVEVDGGSGVVITKCLLRDGLDDGVNAEDTTGLVVEKNRFENLGSDGVDFDDTEGEVDDSTVAKNRFEGIGDDAIDVDGSGHLIEKNRVSAQETGILTEEGSSNIRIEKNKVEKTGGTGIDVAGSDHVVVKNKLRDLGDEGIQVGGDGHRIEKNKIDRADDEAIDVEGSNNQILSNKGKSAGGNGVEVGESESPGAATGNLFEKNKISGSSENGFLVEDSGNTFRANKASKSGDFDLLDNAGGNVYENNKFGTESLP